MFLSSYNSRNSTRNVSAKWNQNIVCSFVKKGFFLSSQNYKLISLLDITCKHHAIPITWYSTASVSYIAQFSITLKKMLQEPLICTPICRKQSFLKLSCKCLILVPKNRWILLMDSSWLSHWNSFYNLKKVHLFQEPLCLFYDIELWGSFIHL